MNSLAIELSRWKLPVKVEVNDFIALEDGMIEFNVEVSEEDLLKNNITKEEVEQEVGNIILKALEDYIRIHKGGDKDE